MSVRKHHALGDDQCFHSHTECFYSTLGTYFLKHDPIFTWDIENGINLFS